jgi:anti-sigma factor RsiW
MPHPVLAPNSLWRSRALPLAFAAALIVGLGIVFLNRITQTSVRVMAAELAIDHVKCSMVNSVLGTHQHHADVERSLAASFSWHAPRAAETQSAGLELVGARTCLYGEGRVAHVMYRIEGRPVSVFMLPDVERRAETVEVMGHREAIWSSNGRTFVVVTREPEAEMRRIVSYVRGALQ